MGGRDFGGGETLTPRLADWLALARPGQWTKNAFVVAPLLFSQRFFDPDYASRVGLAVAAFCLVASASYVVNDIRDAERDRVHRLKRERPLAAGRIAAPRAAAYACLLYAGGAATAVPLGGRFSAILAAFAGLQLAYSFFLRTLPGLDAIAIAAGFVLRAAAGVVAAGAAMSPWLLECTFALALFLALGKRRHEALILDSAASAHRAALARYDPVWLDRLLKLSAAVTLFLYSAYALSPGVAAKLGTERMWITIPFVALGLLRYLFLIYGREDGGDPTGLLLGDLPLQLAIGAWILVVFSLLYAR